MQWCFRIITSVLLFVLIGAIANACSDEIAQVVQESTDQAEPPASRTSDTTEQQRSAQVSTEAQGDDEQEEAEESYEEEAEYEEQADEAEAAMQEEEEMEADEAAAEEGGERSDTGTNIQVSGVDEPDVIKTDGQHFYVLDSERLSVIAITASGLTLRSTVAFHTPGLMHVLGEQQLLLAGDTVLALRTIGINENETFRRLQSTFPNNVFFQWWYDLYASDTYQRGFIDHPMTQLIEIDVSDPAQPWVRRRMEVEGDLLGARLVGSSARVLLRSVPDLLDPETLSPNYQLREYESAVAYTTGHGIDRTDAPLTDINDTFTSGRAVLFADALVSLLTFDLSNEGTGLGRWGSLSAATTGTETTVYSSVNSLYVAQRESYVGPTEIRRFDLSNPMEPTYAGSNEAPGRLINQFALSEFRGHLRVATTLEDVSPTRSEIWIFEVLDDGLEHVSTLTDLGITELIYAVRFMGERAFVVTFRQIDPLYIADLSNPREPFVAGELKLPGFSRYMHPLGSGRLLGVGQDADPSTGQPTGLQLSLFDVSDSYNPRLLDQLKPVPTSRWELIGWPEVDHRAFTYHEGVAYVPSLDVTNWQYEGRVFGVAVECNELSLLGEFSGELETFPVRVIPINDLLYVLSWGREGFLLQRYSPFVPVEVQDEYREQDRLQVSGSSAEYQRLSDCD